MQLSLTEFSTKTMGRFAAATVCFTDMAEKWELTEGQGHVGGEPYQLAASYHHRGVHVWLKREDIARLIWS